MTKLTIFLSATWRTTVSLVGWFMCNNTRKNYTSVVQLEDMARILNAAGYSSTKWIRLARSKEISCQGTIKRRRGEG